MKKITIQTNKRLDSFKLLILSILVIWNTNLFAQFPISDDGGSIEGVLCISCSVDNPENAYDGDLNTYQNYDVDFGLLSYGKTNFTFASTVPSSTVISLTISFPGLLANTFSPLVTSALFQNIRVSLLDNLDNEIFVYDDGNQAAVEVLDFTNNVVKIKIINPYSTVRKVRFEGGGIISLIGNVRLHDVRYEEKNLLFCTNHIESGFFDGTTLLSVNVNNNITNPINATYNDGVGHDVNSEYASLDYLLSVNIADSYLYSKYDWSGTSYSGSQYDLWLYLEDANLVSVSDAALFFDNDYIQLEVTYSDGSTEFLSSGDAVIEADVLFLGTGRFYIKVDLNNSKSVETVELRYKPLVSAASSLRLYTVFLNDLAFGTSPLPVEFGGMDLAQSGKSALVEWKTISETNNDYFELIAFDSFGAEQVFLINGNGTCSTESVYRQEVKDLKEGLYYFCLSQIDLNGVKEHLETKALRLENSGVIEVYPNPASISLTVFADDNSLESAYLINSEGKVVMYEIHHGVNNLPNLKTGMYQLVSEDQDNIAIFIKP